MKRYHLALMAIAVLGAGAIMACDYATKSEMAALRTQYEATHDTLVALWERTNRAIAAHTVMDTVAPPPKCPPACEVWETLRRPMPSPPKRFGPAQPQR